MLLKRLIVVNQLLKQIIQILPGLWFVLKTKYDTDTSELENKIPDTSGLVKKTDYDVKIAEIEGKIPNGGNLATKTSLTTVENKIRRVSNFVKKKQIITLKLQKL